MTLSMLSVFGVAALTSLLLTPQVRAVAIRMRLVAWPKSERWGRRVVAKCGGLSIYAATVSALWMVAPRTSEWIGYAVAATLLVAWGVIDDVKGLSPPVKILGQVIAASIVAGTGTSIESVPWPALSVPLTIFWIVLVTNAVNLLDNMDGLACGVAAISAMVLFGCSQMLGNAPVSLGSLAIAGACCGFLPHNFHPAKIFMGDCGSMFLGFSLAVLSVHGTWGHASNLFLVLLVPVLVLGVPIFDTAFVAINRRLSGRAIWRGGTDHTSHRLVFLGWPERRAVLMLYGISAVLGGLAFAMLNVNLYVSTIVVFLTVAVIVMFGIFLAHLPIYQEDPEVVGTESKDRVQLSASYPYKRRIVEVLGDVMLICASYFIAYVIRFEGVLSPADRVLLVQSLPVVIPVQLVAFFACGVYGGIWRYVGMRDVVNIFRGVFFGTVFSVLVLLLRSRFIGYSRAVFVVDALVLLVLMAGSRVALRLFREYLMNTVEHRGKRAIIVGAGDAGEVLLRELRNNRGLDYRPVGFIDDDPAKIGRSIHGVPVLGNRWSLPMLIEQLRVDEVFMAIPSAHRQAVEEISQICEGCGVPYRRMQRMVDPEA